MRKIAICALVTCLSVACGVPRDPEGTLERVRDGTMRVGFVPNPPWTSGGAPPKGVEGELVSDLAEGLDADIEWHQGSEEMLLTALEARELDLVIGGLTALSPWSSKVALTRSYLTTRVVVGVPEGRSVPEDIEGLEITVEKGTHVPALVEGAGATALEVERLTDTRELTATEECELDDLGLTPTQIVLEESERVLAAPLGENAWLLEVERFLHDQGDDARALLEEFCHP